MAGQRAIQLGLAAGISLAAGIAAFTPLTQAGISDISARDMVLAEFAENPSPPLHARTAAVVGALIAPGPPEAPATGRFGYQPDESGAPALTLSSEQIDFAVVPRIGAGDSGGDGRSLMGFRVTAEPATQGPRWWLVAGAERETYAVAPGEGFRDLNLTQVGGSAAVGDAHVGVAMEVGEDAYLSIGYVQERRHYQLGTQDWEERDHFIGAAFRSRW